MVHVETWHNCRLDEYLLLLFFFLFKIFIFGPWWDPFCSKDLGHPRELKNGGDVFFIFSKSSFLGPWAPFSFKTLGQHIEVKNGPIMLKFIKLIQGVHENWLLC